MKYLKYFLFLILGIVLCFFLLGFMKPAVNYGHEIKVNKPINEAWGFLQDETKMDQWLEGFKSIDLIEGESGTVGSRYKVVVNPGQGQEDFTMTETIKSIKPEDHISLNFDSDMMVFDQTTSLTTKEGQTIIKTDSSVKGKGILMRSMFALMEMTTGSFQKQEVKNIEALKNAIEQNNTVY